MIFQGLRVKFRGPWLNIFILRCLQLQLLHQLRIARLII
jgi:hypothetical protein